MEMKGWRLWALGGRDHQQSIGSSIAGTDYRQGNGIKKGDRKGILCICTEKRGGDKSKKMRKR